MRARYRGGVAQRRAGGVGGPPWAGRGAPWSQVGQHDTGLHNEARFDRLDSDGDGKISKDEILAMHAKADADGDGAVTREELMQHIRNSGLGGSPAARKERPQHARRARSGGGPPPAAALFERFDKNGDGKLTKDEVPEFAAKRLAAADADGDGAVSKTELEEHRKKNQKVQSERP